MVPAPLPAVSNVWFSLHLTVEGLRIGFFLTDLIVLEEFSGIGT
jgi:hypothetical protein